ncbi:imidazolonepropionase [Psychroserpens sp.]|uniref:imidazolonepropionase n=1 Tax=Psychroserpens sp. TaxID=2020870 RepID=UPI001B16DAF7|nr:imidazolonepropionase [Psychroserpens sp.]MBO6606590.1 imidazolonepropionase [Psychroserpens sp.]MBO6632667.1 imidazolonepropionase [Psychroserpens sp.]MBO6653294.1 imidazolonepropionase [Psychroserpens sp.]MBO6680679.1 imidazolonepropionase [Psychroserpens sp.]MBO6750363.1 imidazolonepropionase [Psychroserpens sp.]
MSILIKNIKQLLQVRETNVTIVAGEDMKHLPVIEDAYLLIEHDTIVEYGLMRDLYETEAETIIDATGKLVLPTWCDSHTHLVYAGDRTQEFVDRINGLSYEDIAKRGGGILNSAKQLQNTSEDALYDTSAKRLIEVIKMGTGAIEIKTGYGLTKASELKMLNIIQRLKKDFPVKVKPTLLAAHAIPEEFKNDKNGYIELIINDIIPEAAKNKQAEFIDVFCEEGYFDLDDTERILQAGVAHRLIPKIHVNQFNAFGGVGLGVKYKALSVDHLEELNPEDIEVLKGSVTIPVALPLCSYFLGIPYTDGRALIDAGLPLAIATDYNPGSSPSGNMNQVVAAACIKMKLTPEEAINAATINGAYAIGVSNMYGSICRGKKANIIITNEMPNYHHLPYAFGRNHIDQVIINGKIFE